MSLALARDLAFDGVLHRNYLLPIRIFHAIIIALKRIIP
jgi:hypothetical protein